MICHTFKNINWHFAKCGRGGWRTRTWGNSWWNCINNLWCSEKGPFSQLSKSASICSPLTAHSQNEISTAHCHLLLCYHHCPACPGKRCHRRHQSEEKVRILFHSMKKPYSYVRQVHKRHQAKWKSMRTELNTRLRLHFLSFAVDEKLKFSGRYVIDRACTLQLVILFYHDLFCVPLQDQSMAAEPYKDRPT